MSECFVNIIVTAELLVAINTCDFFHNHRWTMSKTNIEITLKLDFIWFRYSLKHVK